VLETAPRRRTSGEIFDRLQRANYRLLPKVQSDEIAEYVDPILAWEREHRPQPLDGTDD
jgi:hypothetical protein